MLLNGLWESLFGKVSHFNLEIVKKKCIAPPCGHWAGSSGKLKYVLDSKELVAISKPELFCVFNSFFSFFLTLRHISPDRKGWQPLDRVVCKVQLLVHPFHTSIIPLGPTVSHQGALYVFFFFRFWYFVKSSKSRPLGPEKVSPQIITIFLRCLQSAVICDLSLIGSMVPVVWFQQMYPVCLLEPDNPFGLFSRASLNHITDC